MQKKYFCLFNIAKVSHSYKIFLSKDIVIPSFKFFKRTS